MTTPQDSPPLALPFSAGLGLAPLPPPTCGALVVGGSGLFDPVRAVWTSYSADNMLAYAAQAVAAEREACANACEDEGRKWEGDGSPAALSHLCAAAVRARPRNTAGPSWQPIETAPRNSKPVLIFEPGEQGGVFKAHLARMMNKQDEWITCGALHKLRPTHWMPLPAGHNV